MIKDDNNQLQKVFSQGVSSEPLYTAILVRLILTVQLLIAISIIVLDVQKHAEFLRNSLFPGETSRAHHTHSCRA